MNKFKKNKYLIIKKAVDAKVTNFIKDYIVLKKKVAESIIKITNKNEIHPVYGRFGDGQVSKTFNMYGDPATDILLKNLKPLMEKQTGLELVETYSYCRVYKKDDTLIRHKDRPSCEISTTLNLGGDHWPIYLDPTEKKNLKGLKVDLKPGDMLIYSGCDLEHWREPFKGEVCVQVFLHYNRKNEKNLQYDGRLHLGMPHKKEISIPDQESDFLVL
mgnify:CR=1 FL=1|jgi:hypothetical protein|tara:strand:- start:1175 stop:1822 length:648 start_codon:yes stop_codon:yes gene_type:complete